MRRLVVLLCLLSTLVFGQESKNDVETFSFYDSWTLESVSYEDVIYLLPFDLIFNFDENGLYTLEFVEVDSFDRCGETIADFGYSYLSGRYYIVEKEDDVSFKFNAEQQTVFFEWIGAKRMRKYSDYRTSSMLGMSSISDISSYYWGWFCADDNLGEVDEFFLVYALNDIFKKGVCRVDFQKGKMSVRSKSGKTIIFLMRL
ncbi:hypothetical protein SapgrDRAFT_1253 [Saprospira grandis DSM 2844]|uniref:Lipocalin-like domain-containing protein n=1 Tax=Saprospira grandis DSM 2844 TaxID=694433 RepID=J0XVD9_9BACT|nr:hypothetical protein [Saprospira grandis]EJF52976.1 hypothetical protein SapgrDRAFT_1253 [Saprospira grandis DSM 2844]